MPRIILVGGGSSSGKTYVTKAVLDALGSDNFTRISMDDYYKCHTNLSMEERAALNYDHPKAFDWKLMREQVKALKNGQAIDKPIYDFVTHDRLPETERVEPSKVIVLEGIMALVDAEIREMGDIKIFINASPERRFLRRLRSSISISPPSPRCMAKSWNQVSNTRTSSSTTTEWRTTRSMSLPPCSSNKSTYST